MACSAVAGLETAEKLVDARVGGVGRDAFQIRNQCLQTWRQLGKRRDAIEIAIVSQIVTELGFEHCRRVLVAHLPLELFLIRGIIAEQSENL